MKHTPLPPGKPPARRTRLKARGRGRFRLRRHRGFMGFLTELIEAGAGCDAECGRYASDRAHLVPRSRGGDDLNNVCLLCRRCHDLQEKRTDQFIMETGVNLYGKAQAHTRRFRAERPQAAKAAAARLAEQWEARCEWTTR